MPAKKGVPAAQLQPFVDDIATALGDISTGGDPVTHADTLMQAVDLAAQAAWSLAKPEAASGWTRPFSASFGDIVGANVKALRVEAGWSQERLAGAMADEGFSWKRITCAEVEANTRRVTLEELIILAALFSEPALKFLLPDDKTALDVPERDIPPDIVRELLLGSGGEVGKGGLAWRAAYRALGDRKDTGKKRPAVDLWREREASNTKATRSARKSER